MHQRAFIICLLATGLLLGIGSASAAEGDATAGKQKAAACAACHGADGLGIAPNYPVIAGQYQDYLIRALHEYKSGSRQNAIMQGMAAPLSEQDILDITAYYSHLPSKLTDLDGAIQGDD